MKKLLALVIAVMLFLPSFSVIISQCTAEDSIMPNWASPGVKFLYGWLLSEYFPTDQLNSTILHMEQYFKLSSYPIPEYTPTYWQNVLNLTLISKNSQQAEFQLVMAPAPQYPMDPWNFTWSVPVTWNYTWNDHKWWSGNYSFDFLPIYIPPAQLSGNPAATLGGYQTYKVVSTDNMTGRTIFDYYQRDTGILMLRISYLIGSLGTDLIVMGLISTDLAFQKTSSLKVDNQTFTVVFQSNSDVSNLTVDINAKKISFTVGGFKGTEGTCNVTIPKELLNAPSNGWQVLVDNQPPMSLTITWNSTHTFIHFTYNHTTHTVEIIGTQVIPEFLSALTIMFPLAFVTIYAVMKKKRH